MASGPIEGAGIKRILRTALAAVLLLTFTAQAQQTIHVPANRPTIQAGIDAAQSGDIVLVSPGLYNENIDFKGKGITVTSGARSYAEAAATVINGVASGPVVKMMTGEPASAVLNGFTVQGGFALQGSTDVAAGVAIFGSSPTIKNSIIQKNIGCGVVVSSGGSPTIQGNDIRQNRTIEFTQKQLTAYCRTPSWGTNAGVGVALLSAGSVVLEGNIIEQNSTLDSTEFLPGGDTDLGFDGAGIYIVLTKKVLVSNNIVRNNASASLAGLFAPQGGKNGQIILIQNLFYVDQNGPPKANAFVELGSGAEPTRLIAIDNTFGSSLELDQNYTRDSLVANNIIARLDCNYVPAPPVISHNDIHGPSLYPSFVCPLGPGNLTADPQFISPSTGDFHTQRTSPVVAVGDITVPQIPPADLDGKNRTVCGTIDMGVYEVHPKPAVVVTSSNNPSVGGTDVTFSAVVPGNCNVPTGTATFFDGAGALGTETLSSGATASLTTSSLTVGSHNITSGYSGDFNFDPSTSAPPLVQVVTGYPTITTLNVSPNPVNAFGAITLTSTVSSSFGTPPGTVSFTANGKVLATATLNANGQASATVSSLGAGTYSIVASYTATVNYAASSSAATTETLVGAESVTALNASPNPALVGQTVTFAVTVKAAQGQAIPTGSVTFSEGRTTLGTAALTSPGVSSFSTSSLGPGTHAIMASYGGDANFNISSASVTETVTLITTTTSLAASPNPAGAGQPVRLTATAASSSAGIVPTGTVTFLDGGTAIGTGLINTSGQAELTVSTLTVGTHALTAVYQGAGSEGGSTSSTVSEVIIASAFNLSLTPATLTLGVGQTGTVTVQLGSTGAYAGTLSLSTAALPAYVSGTFGSSSVQLQANGNVTTPLTISTQVLPVAALHAPGWKGSTGVLSGTLAAMLLMPWGFARRRRLTSLLLIAFVATMAFSITGCTNIGYAIHTVHPGTYVVPVTAVDASGKSKTASLMLVITP